MEQRGKYLLWSLLIVALHIGGHGGGGGGVVGEALRLPDQQQQTQNVQSIFPQQQQQQQQLQQQPILQQQQQPLLPQQQQLQQSPAGFGETQGRSSILSLFGFGQEQDPFLARTSSKCLTGDLSECFKNQALSSFDEIFFKDQYPLSDFASIVRMPENQQRSLSQEPFEYSQEPRADDTDWDQLVKYGLRRAERFIKSTALQVDIPVEFTEAGRYDARFIGNDIDSELDVIEDKHAPLFTRKKLKRMIIPLLLVLKIFKLKLLLFLPFILGIAGLKKILTLGALILPGVFAYFKLCRPPGSGPAFGGFFKNTFPEYTSQGVGAATYYHNHEHYDTTGTTGPYYRPEPTFSKPYTDYYSKNYQTGAGTGNAVSFGDHSGHDAAYTAYYGRNNNGKDIQSTQKS